MKHAIGIIGAGLIAETMHLPVLTSMPGVQVAWLTDVEPERAEAVARAYAVPSAGLPADPRELPPCDAVLLAIPPRVRMPYIEAFADRGTAVLAEKPFATSLEEHRRILELFPRDRIGCGLQRRTYATTRLARRLVRSGWLGPLRALSIREGSRITSTGADHSHLDDAKLAGGGVLLSLGCHSLDWALFVAAAERYEILARDLVFDGALDRKVSARIRLHGPGGATDLEYVVSWLDAQPNTLTLRFDAAEAVVGVAPGASLELREPGARRSEATLLPHAPGATTANQAFFLEWRAFLEGLERGEPSEVSAESALLTTELIEALYRDAGAA